MIENLKLTIEVTKFPAEDTSPVTISDNIETESPLFGELISYLAEDQILSKIDHRSHLSLVEKLEILCKKVREYNELYNSDFDDYYEVKAIEWNDKRFLEKSDPIKMYDEIICLGKDLFMVIDNNKFGLISSTKEILPVEYDSIDRINDYCISVKKLGVMSIYDQQGELLLDQLEDSQSHFNPFGDYKDYIWAKRQGKWGLFDPYMKPLIPFRLEFDRVHILYTRERDDIYIKIFKDGKCGLINGILNITIVPLNDQIADIFYNDVKHYVIVNKTEQIEKYLSDEEVKRIEDEIKKQN